MRRAALSAFLSICLLVPAAAAAPRPVRLIVSPASRALPVPYAPVTRPVRLETLRLASLPQPQVLAAVNGTVARSPGALELVGTTELPSSFGAAADGGLAGRLDNGAEVYELQTGPLKAKVYLDAETQAFVRGLPPGGSVGIFGSQALDMLKADGVIARTGHMDPSGDVDLFYSASANLKEEIEKKAAAAYPNDVQLLYSVNAMMLLVQNFSIAKLSLSFAHAGAGKIVARWEGPLFGDAQRLQAYEDLLAGRIRYAVGFDASAAIEDRVAVQGLVYAARYPGMAWEERTRELVAAALGSERFSGLAQKRMKKLFQRAVDPGSVIELLKELGVYRGAVRRAARRALLKSGRLAEALASPVLSEETRRELAALQASGKPRD